MLHLYPLNILCTALAAGITVYLGFLPIKDVPRRFFIQQSFLTIILWAIAGLTVGIHVGGYLIGCGLMATTAWRQFCLQREFIAKLWLSGAAAFGGTLCLLLIIPALPLPPGASVWFVTAVYFGAFVLTATHMATMVALSAKQTTDAIPRVYLERALAFVFLALTLRIVLLAGMIFGFPSMFTGWGSVVVHYLTHTRALEFYLWIGGGLVVPAALSFIAWNKAKKGAEPAALLWILITSQIFAFAGEFLVRRLYF